MDDGQIYTKPENVEIILRRLDQRLASAGATRGMKSVNGSVKSMVRVYTPADRQEEVVGWDTAYVRDTCNVLSSTELVKVLGGYSGSDEQIRAKFAELCGTVE